jgi:hypothetical protein
MKTQWMVSRLAFLLLVLLVLGSCSKKSDPTPATKTQLLTQNTWKLTGVTYGGAAIPGATFTGELLMRPNKTYSFSLTATVMGASISAVETGAWVLAADEMSFTMTPDNPGTSGITTLTSEIITLDAANLQYKQNVDGQEVSYTFVKK